MESNPSGIETLESTGINLAQVMSAFDTFIKRNKDYFLLNDDESAQMRAYFEQELKKAIMSGDPRAVDNGLTALVAKMLQHFTQNPRIAEMVRTRLEEGISTSGGNKQVSETEKKKTIERKARQILQTRGGEFSRSLRQAMSVFIPDAGEVDDSKLTALAVNSDERATNQLPGANITNIAHAKTWPIAGAVTARGTMIIQRPQIPTQTPEGQTPLTSEVSTEPTAGVQPRQKATRTQVLMLVGGLAATAAVVGGAYAFQSNQRSGNASMEALNSPVANEKDAGADAGVKETTKPGL